MIDPRSVLLYFFKFLTYIGVMMSCNGSYLLITDADLREVKKLKEWVKFNTFCIAMLFYLDVPFLISVILGTYRGVVTV